MDAFTMTNKQQNDFESRFFDLLQDKIDSLESYMQRMEKKLDANTTMTKDTNGRVGKLEAEVFGRIKSQNIAWYRDPTVLRIMAYLSLALLLLVGAAVRTDVGKIIQ